MLSLWTYLHYGADISVSSWIQVASVYVRPKYKFSKNSFKIE